MKDEMKHSVDVNQDFTSHQTATKELRFAPYDGQARTCGAIQKQQKNTERLQSGQNRMRGDHC